MATKSQKDRVWNKAAKARGKNPNLYRKDPYGNLMYKPSHGKSSEMGWDIDHIKPRSKGGSNRTHNLQALNSSVNRSKGNTARKKSRHSKQRTPWW